MIEAERLQACQTALRQLRDAGIALTPEETEHLEIADFGLNEFDRIGLALVTYVNNDRYCAKELILQPGQICPEHRHPPLRGFSDNPGKQETFRVRQGTVCLYVPGEESPDCRERTAQDKAGVFTVFHRITLMPGCQYTLAPDTLHWFQAGTNGAIVSEFSSPSDDASDIFTDPRIRRLP